MNRQLLGSTGWRRDLPDFRDYTRESEKIDRVLSLPSIPTETSPALVAAGVDLRKWCSSVENQQSLGSCTANAGVAMMEYYQKRLYGQYLDGSRLFLYKATRSLLGWVGDTGATIRATMKAMTLFGIPPEEYWPYDINKFEEEPPAFVYALAQNYQALHYYRLDPPGRPLDQVLLMIKKNLVAGMPIMFGFSVYSSMPGIGQGVDIPFPKEGDALLGGHAVMACGFDPARQIGDCTGALLIRNSWGLEFGDGGYGWMPESYVLKGLACDFWALVKAEFANTSLMD